MANEIVAGSTVMLKSGGPTMTVMWIDDGDAYCEWFDSKGEPQGRRYPLVGLKPA